MILGACGSALAVRQWGESPNTSYPAGQGANCHVTTAALLPGAVCRDWCAKQIASEDAALVDQGDRWKECEAELVEAQQKVEELQGTLKQKAGR